MKQVLTLEQARAIHDAGYELPNNSNPLLCYVNHYQEEDIAWNLQVYDELFENLDEWCIPTYTVGELLQLFPIKIVDKVREQTFRLTTNFDCNIHGGYFFEFAYKLNEPSYRHYTPTIWDTSHIKVNDTIDGLFNALMQFNDLLTQFPLLEAKYK